MTWPLRQAIAAEDTLPEAGPRDRSLWEAGIVGGEAYLPDYPAAAQNHAKWIVAPYIIYRGKIMRADREGARARLLRQRYFDIEMGFAASFKTNSADNDARRGMSDLDYLLELGPRLSVPITDFGGRGRLRLFVPLRSVFSTNFKNFKHRGFTATPALYARWNHFLRRDWLGIAQLTATFGDRQLNAYFYDVAPEFATLERPSYDARAGYIGSDLFSGVVVPFGERWRLFSGVQWLVHEGSANAASPLFRRTTNYSLIVGLTWMFYQSAKPAAAPL